MALIRRRKVQDRIDPIRLSEVDESNEWLIGRMEEDANDDFVFEDELLTWDVVGQASGASEPYYNSRSKTKQVANKGKGKAPMVEFEEEDEEEYNFSEDANEEEEATIAMTLHEGLEDSDDGATSNSDDDSQQPSAITKV